MTTIDEHTFDEKLLTGGLVIDAGCRGFKFSESLRDLGCEVCALDVENDFFDIEPDGVTYFRKALWPENEEHIVIHSFGNGTANFVKGLNGIPSNTEDRPCIDLSVTTINIEEIMWMFGGLTEIDLLKADIEGSEYKVLAGLVKPYARQISCEFHPHCHPNLHAEMFDKVIAHLSQWYQVSYHSNYPDYPSLDTLFIRRDLL